MTTSRAGSRAPGGALRGVARLEQTDRIAATERSGRHHARVHATPAGVTLLRDERVVAVAEGRPDVEARAGVPGDLEQHVVAQLQAHTGLHGGPVEALERDVLAERARHERMALVLEVADRFHRV